MSTETLRCPKCVSSDWKTANIEPKHNDALRCARCGHRSTTELLVDTFAADTLKEMMKKSFGASSHIKFRI